MDVFPFPKSQKYVRGGASFVDEDSLKLTVKGGLHPPDVGIMLKSAETVLTETTSKKLTVVSQEAIFVITFIERSYTPALL